MTHPVFSPADILLPREQCPLRTTAQDSAVDLQAYSVIACDQFTAEPAYWARVAERTNGLPSSYHMVFPEVLLAQGDVQAKIKLINQTMHNYLSDDVFAQHTACLIYVERTLRDGRVRKGLVGKIDLAHYDYQPDSQTAVRATEGTVLERIPPRVCIRKDAPLELPHVLLLLDDPTCSIIEPLAGQTADFQQVYDFDLMEDSGHLRGFKLSRSAEERVMQKLATFGNERHVLDPAQSSLDALDSTHLLFAVGDGNHSLATAKACYERLKETLSEAEVATHPARYALVELGNLHDESLIFEPIHRVVFDVNPQDLLTAFGQVFGLIAHRAPQKGEQHLQIVIGTTTTPMTILNPEKKLTVGTLQQFLDDYIAQSNRGEVDYIHGEDVVVALCEAQADRIGFLLPSFHKDALFPAVMQDGPLPRKTFSMGEAWDKRFYLEARMIR